jgi:hypothetical protein
MHGKLELMGVSPRIALVLESLFRRRWTRKARLHLSGETAATAGDNPGGLFDDVPGPTPWYLAPTTRTVKGFRWQPAGDTPLSSGKTLLVGSDGPLVVLNFYNYVMMLDESSLLIWHQQWSEGSPTQPVRLLVVHPNRLTPLAGDLDCLYETMNDHRLPIILGGEPTAGMSLETHNCTDEVRTEFPKQTHSANELLILCKSSGIPTGVVGERSNSALLVAHPRQSMYRLYPQDWFNSGGHDYAYEWVTRVVRSSRTGQVHGEGMRIGPFILDDTLRKLCQ